MYGSLIDRIDKLVADARENPKAVSTPDLVRALIAEAPMTEQQLTEYLLEAGRSLAVIAVDRLKDNGIVVHEQGKEREKIYHVPNSSTGGLDYEAWLTATLFRDRWPGTTDLELVGEVLLTKPCTRDELAAYVGAARGACAVPQATVLNLLSRLRTKLRAVVHTAGRGRRRKYWLSFDDCPSA
jgi:hypothetical protein